MPSPHTFHIPVMGIGFTIDSPLKVARYGISSVISLVDDELIEEMRQYYCRLLHEEYTPITKYDNDYRARRITEYLNLVDRIVRTQFEELRSSPFAAGSELTRYFELLPDDSSLKVLYHQMLGAGDPILKEELQRSLRSQISPGEINVNIMTKLDRDHCGQDGQTLSDEFSDALSALRGYALSTLNSGMVFSAGINRRLYSYMEKFKDFYADATGFIKKKIILKVTDYRSSIIQGRFLTKKGLWVSEYRVESGLNCGGHAFASDGFLMGPILEEFKKKKAELISSLHQIYNEALQARKQIPFDKPHEVRITAQGGIGTPHENNFLRNFYGVDSTGWGTPFLLVPEVTNVDEETLQKLSRATEDDVYLSDVSPLGVPFNNLRGSLSDTEKDRRAEAGRPGSACPKGYLASNTEFTENPICTASRQYQKLKIDQLTKLNLNPAVFKQKLMEVVKKACICNDLGASVLIKNKIVGKTMKRFTAICPGPNIAYFSKIATLEEMVGHIYGRNNLLNEASRPHMFIKELKLYVEYFINEIKKIEIKPTEKQIQHWSEFRKNLLEGIEYYRGLFPQMLEETQEYRQKALNELEFWQKKITEFVSNHVDFFPHPAAECVAV